MVGQTIRQLKDKQFPVKLGTQDGSGFIFCGEMSELDTDQLDMELVEAKARSICFCEDTIKRTRSKLKNGKTEYPKYVEKCKDENYITYEEWKQMLQTRLNYYTKEKPNRIQNMIDYVRVSERKVVETYRSVTEDAIIVIMEGDESGLAWTTEEFKKGVNSDTTKSDQNKMP